MNAKPLTDAEYASLLKHYENRWGAGTVVRETVNRLIATVDDLRGQVDAAETELEKAEDERQAAYLATGMHGLVRGGLVPMVHALAAERDALRAQRDGALAKLATAEAERDALLAERRTLADIEAELEETRAQGAEMVSGLASRVMAAEAERDAAETKGWNAAMAAAGSEAVRLTAAEARAEAAEVSAARAEARVTRLVEGAKARRVLTGRVAKALRWFADDVDGAKDGYSDAVKAARTALAALDAPEGRAEEHGRRAVEEARRRHG